MVSVGALRNILKTRAKQLSAPATALVSYLELFADGADLDTSVMQNFISDAMTYPHWQQNKAELDRFLRDTTQQLGLEATRIAFPIDFALTTIFHEKQSHRIIERYIQTGGIDPAAKLRIYTESEDQFVAVIWHPTEGFRIAQFTNQFRVQDGVILPLQTHLHVRLDTNLRLIPNVRHRLEIKPFTHMAWWVNESGLHGTALKGFRFQKMGQFNEYPERLFLYLQKLQSFFLKKEIHPYYQQLTQKLETMIREIKLKVKVSPKSILELESQVRSALEMVFVGDKLLGLLLRDVNHLLGNQEWQISNALINTSPIAESAPAEKPMNSSMLDEFL